MEFILVIIVVVGGIVALNIVENDRKQNQIKALRLSDIDNMNGIQFEHYVAQLLRHQGFRAHVTRGSGDLGVDIIAQKHPDKYSIQVKRQQKNVSRRAISDAVAGKDHYGCNAAMVITNIYFTAGAQELAKSTKCKLVDRTELTNWIIAFQKSQIGK